MLILQRKLHESLYIGDDIYIEVMGIDNDRVRLAIRAPESIPILRTELRNAMAVNRDASEEQSTPQELMGLLDTVLGRPGKTEK
ncbi:MAG: carbon storage regulator [Oscillospiraceae bacterium]|nr:carbon storage regulator [Oscillospiraceae bacterium]